MTPQIYLAVASMRRFMKRHHSLLFIIFLGILLVTAVFSLYQALSVIFTGDQNTNSKILQFDQKTVEKIKNLQDSSERSDSKLVFPAPRSGPFDE